MQVSAPAVHSPRRLEAAGFGRAPRLLHGFPHSGRGGGGRDCVDFALASRCPGTPVRTAPCPARTAAAGVSWESSLFFGVVRVQHRDQSQNHWHGRTRNEDVHVGGHKENQLSKWPASPRAAGRRPLWSGLAPA